MPRGRKKSHKGGHRHFTSEDDLEAEAEKQRKEQQWRKMKGIESESDEEEKEGEEEVGATKPKPVKKPATGQPGDLPPSDSESESEEEDDDDDRPKGVSHLIEIENPNRVKQKTKKVTALNTEGGEETQISRKQREELERQAAKERYDKLHQAGKTDEARADLARLALIKKQREEAAKKRDEERRAQEAAKEAAEKKLLEKKKASAAAGDKQ